MASEGTFVLADIGGYTQFLTDVGIKHAKEITSHLLNGMLRVNRGRWKIANVIGDCVFFYTETREPPAEFFAHLRALYEQFRGATTDIAARSNCPCGACTRGGDLTLKFVVHAGEFDVQTIGGRRELIGADIIIAHRLLKNSVPVTEYALVTAGCSEIAGASGLPAVTGHDDFQDVGAIDYRYVDLEPARREFEERCQVFVSDADARLAVSAMIDAPAEVVWDAFMDLDKRRQWQTTIKEMDELGGRRGEVGEIHRCLHEDGTRMIHYTVAIDEAGYRKTEKIWLLPRLLRDIYITLEAKRLDSSSCRASLYVSVQPALPVVSHVAIPVILYMMKKDIGTDMEGLKAFCEGQAGIPAEARAAEEPER